MSKKIRVLTEEICDRKMIVIDRNRNGYFNHFHFLKVSVFTC
jgi:hypothetical protein